jgi:acid stress chaperone HdeB
LEVVGFLDENAYILRGDAMKAIIASVAVLFLLTHQSSAEDMDFSKIKCSDFLSSPKDQISIVLAWLEGYYTKEDAPPIMYSEKVIKDAKALSEYCNGNRDDDIIKAAEKVMPVK